MPNCRRDLLPSLDPCHGSDTANLLYTKDSSVDGYNECVEITDKNLIGYVYCDDRVAFVLLGLFS